MKTVLSALRPLLVVVASFAATVFVSAQDPAPVGPPPNGGPGFGGPGGRGPGGPMMPQQLKILKQFDRDGDKVLNAAERAAAREYLRANPAPRRGPRGFGRGADAEPNQPGESLTPADVKTYGSEPLYDYGTLRTLFFTFEEKDWEKELEEFHNTDVDVAATMVVDGKTYRDVGIHFRGASSYFMVSAGQKRSLNVTIDHANAKQNLLGYRTLNLLNSHEDASFLRAPLYSRIAQEYLPTPRMNFVRVVINGENWGIYANAEQFNKDFMADRFQSPGGVRWKVPGSPGGRGSLAYLGDDPAPYRSIYEIKNKDEKKSWAKLARLCKVLNETPADQLEAALSPLFDIDGALRFLALDITFSNGDGYWTRTSDYSIGEDAKGRLHVMPHDMNETFSFGGAPGGPGGRGRFGPPAGFAGGAGPNQPGAGNANPGAPDQGFGPPNNPAGAGRGPGGPMGRGGRGMGGGGTKLDPLITANNPNTPLASKLLAVPALRERYLGYVRELAEKWLDWQHLAPIARQYHTLIDADVKRETRKLESYEDFVASLDESPRSLKAFVDQRRAYLLELPAIKDLPRRAP